MLHRLDGTATRWLHTQASDRCRSSSNDSPISPRPTRAPAHHSCRGAAHRHGGGSFAARDGSSRCARCRLPAAGGADRVGGRQPTGIRCAGARVLWAKRPLLPADPGTSVSAALALATTWRAAALIGVTGADAPFAGEPLPGGLTAWRVAGESAHYERVALMKLTSGSTGLPKKAIWPLKPISWPMCSTLSRPWASVQTTCNWRLRRCRTPTRSATSCCRCCGRARLWCCGTVSCRMGWWTMCAAHGVRVWPGVPFMFE